MGKPKFASHEEAKENLSTTKEELQVAKDELKSYRKEHKLEKDTDYSEDAKHGKTWKKLTKAITSKEEAIAETRTWMEENKPKKEKVARESKYEYPADCTSEDDKKKFRAKMRREAASAEKAAAGGEAAPKKEKKASKEEAAAEAPKEEKKSKKDKKASKED